MLKNLSIGKRLAYGSAFLVLLLIIGGIAGYAGSQSVSTAAVHAVKDAGGLADLASEAKIETLQLRRFEKDSFLNIDDAAKRNDYVAKWNKESEQLTKLLQEFAGKVQNPADKQRAEQMIEHFRAYEAGYKTVLAGMGTKNGCKTPEDCNVSIGAYKASIHELENLANSLNEDYTAQMLQQVPVINGIVARTGWVIIGVTLLSLAVSIPFTIFLTRSIVRPVRSIVDVAREISRGHLNVSVGEERRGDEIGELHASFAEMISYLKEMSAVSATIAQGDLTVAVKPRSADDRLSHAFLAMTSSLRNMISSVREAASQVASGSTQVAQASDETAKISVKASSSIDEVTSTMHEMSTNSQSMLRNTQAQAASVRQTSASIEEMVVSIRRVDEHLQRLVEISQRSGAEVKNGITTTEKANQGLERIHKSIVSSAETITLLGDRADSIGKIVDVIDDLAEQTNLLALNAAIEAARAGENGLGFSVVADEVRKLAEKSAASTKEIGELIQTIQKEARNAVRNMEQSTTIVDESMELGTGVTSALAQIAKVVGEVDQLTKEIGSATTEQSSGSSQIAVASTRLNEITHEISSAVEEQSAGASTVVKTMERMQEIVQQSSSSATELAASAEQMTRMARLMVDATERFTLDRERQQPNPGRNGHGTVSEKEPRQFAAFAGAVN